jgi:hypothetical protein
MYTIEQVMAQINAENSIVVNAALVVYGIGFLQYSTSLYMQIKHKECPAYFWQHCWNFGHDLVFALLFYQWFVTIDFWLFKVLCIGCIAFVGIELLTLFYSIKYERQQIWGKYSSKPITSKAAWIRGITGYAIGAILFGVIRLAIGDVMCIVLMMSTNAIAALMSHLKLEESRHSKSSTILLSWLLIFGTVFTFMPPGIGFFTSAVTSLHSPWFYSLGALCLLATFRFMILAYKYRNPLIMND